mmetsp:Transcript_25364/g.35562  ORF Transcript_25364/g.35562 Transcript_25364/m.35562 type:complete len:281 (-) Transcript_25364:310-1152(-)
MVLLDQPLVQCVIVKAHLMQLAQDLLGFWGEYLWLSNLDHNFQWLSKKLLGGRSGHSVNAHIFATLLRSCSVHNDVKFFLWCNVFWKGKDAGQVHGRSVSLLERKLPTKRVRPHQARLVSDSPNFGKLGAWFNLDLEFFSSVVGDNEVVVDKSEAVELQWVQLFSKSDVIILGVLLHLSGFFFNLAKLLLLSFPCSLLLLPLMLSSLLFGFWITPIESLRIQRVIERRIGTLVAHRRNRGNVLRHNKLRSRRHHRLFDQADNQSQFSSTMLDRKLKFRIS